MTFHCIFDLRGYPMDSQLCQIQIGSYSYTSSDIQFDKLVLFISPYYSYAWKADKAIQLKSEFVSSTVGFITEDVTTDECHATTSTGCTC